MSEKYENQVFSIFIDIAKTSTILDAVTPFGRVKVGRLLCFSPSNSGQPSDWHISHLEGPKEEVVSVGIIYLGIYSAKVISHLEGTKEERAIWRQATMF